MNVRAATIVEEFGMIDAYLGESVASQVETYREAVSELAAAPRLIAGHVLGRFSVAIATRRRPPRAPGALGKGRGGADQLERPLRRGPLRILA